MSRVVVFMDNGTELSIDGSPIDVATLAAEISKALGAPGGVLTLNARDDAHVIPVRAIRHVRVEPEETR